jgi:regulator of sirC expression with transglutaminase-like and TPR domain
MNLPRLPICCNKIAYDQFVRCINSVNATDDLLCAVVAIAMHGDPEANLEVVKEEIKHLVTLVRNRTCSRNSRDNQDAIQAHLHDVLFDGPEPERFRKNTADYYHPDNCLISQVLATKRGNPTILSLIYHIVAKQLGFYVWGVNLPDYFIVGIKVNGKIMYVDPSHEGQSFNTYELRLRHENTFGRSPPWHDKLRGPVPNSAWLTRITRNLTTAYDKSKAYNNVAAMLELQIALWPGEDYLKRDLGFALCYSGKYQAARHVLGWYLERNPQDREKQKIEKIVAQLNIRSRSP